MEWIDWILPSNKVTDPYVYGLILVYVGDIFLFSTYNDCESYLITV